MVATGSEQVTRIILAWLDVLATVSDSAELVAPVHAAVLQQQQQGQVAKHVCAILTVW